ncbi:MAG: hypothetical protein IJP95_05800 [Bacteroidales bacterium]|nr:hypothetical protein [Bacteroidales bacterium]
MKRTFFIIGFMVVVGLMATSCKKEKVCECKYKRSYADDANIYSFQLEVKIDKGNCEDIATYSTTDRSGIQFTSETTCTQKE